jgi:glycosyltransferase involved in cell wall biosynthesis
MTTVHGRYDTRIFIKECRSLALAGYDVTLLVADGKGAERIEGITIQDVGLPKNRMIRVLFFTRKLYKEALKQQVECYHFHDPELMIAGYFLSKKGKKVIYDIHENVGEQIKIKEWIPSLLRNTVARVYDKIESFFCKRFDALLVPQPSMQERFLPLNPNTYLVENFPLNNETQPINRDSPNGHKVICFHAGSLNEDRGLRNMVNAFEHLPLNFELHLGGAIEESTLTKCEDLPGWKNVLFYGKIPFNEVQEIYAKTSIGLILYNNVGQYYLSYAVKLFEYMSYGIPVIMPDFGEWVGFNQENNCGINVDPSKSQEVAKAIRFLAENPEVSRKLGINGLKAVREKYTWDKAKSRLLTCYKKIQYD